MYFEVETKGFDGSSQMGYQKKRGERDKVRVSGLIK